MALEILVRRYQKPQTSSGRRLISTREVVDVQPAILSWGAPGQLPEKVEVPIGEVPPLYAFEVKKKGKEQQETAKVTEKVRIENPDDPDQYVVTERIKSIRFKEKDPDKLKSYPDRKNSTAYAGATDVENWQPGETQVNSDGTGPTQPGETRVKYDDTVPLTVESRDFLFKSAEGFYTNIPPDQ